MKGENSCTMLQPGKTRSRTTVKSRRHQYDIVLTEYREPSAIAMGGAGIISHRTGGRRGDLKTVNRHVSFVKRGGILMLNEKRKWGQATFSQSECQPSKIKLKDCA